MISAFEIYLVMQLDTIKFFVGFWTVSLAILTLAWCRSAADSKDDKMFALGKYPAMLAAVFMMLGAVLPNSKTAAAMIVLPAITSDSVIEKVTPEAAQLYGMAKDALRNLSKKEPEKENDD